jgi:predicted RND superfamily exporter protein
MAEFVLILLMIPIMFSYFAPPKPRQLKHLEGKRLNFIIEKIKNIVFNHRKLVYIVTVIFIGICVYGVTLMRTSGKLVDDLKHTDPVFKDLKFFEKNFGGVMPFEISIDTKKKNGVMKISNIQKIDELEQVLAEYPVFSRPLSLAEFAKFAKQSFYNGDTSFYEVPNNNEAVFIFSYLPTKVDNGKNMLRTFIDSTKRYTRISVQMADVGTAEMNAIESSLRPRIDSIFNPEKYTVTMTGNSLVYTKGTEFLIGNLWESVIIGIIFISLIIAVVFKSSRMVIIAILCNLIPLVCTAAVMGFFHIPVKPSTLIVFSVALGIAIDNAILFLAKYKTELFFTGGNVKEAVAYALDEAGISMIYTAIVLVIGFAVFVVSGFGATQALGMLISFTLFMALFFNIIVLPSLIMTFKKV